MPTACKPVDIENLIYTTAELADLFDVSVQNVLALARRGVLHPMEPIPRGQNGGRFRLGINVRAYLAWIMRDVELTPVQLAKASLQLEEERRLAAEGFE